MKFLLVLENIHPHIHTYAGLLGEKNIHSPKTWILHTSHFDYTDDGYVPSSFPHYPDPLLLPGRFMETGNVGCLSWSSPSLNKIS